MVGKILTVFVIVILSIIILFFTSCGTTRAVVRNGTDSAVTSITITTNNPLDVQAHPNISTTLNPQK